MSQNRLSLLETAALILALLFAAVTAHGADAGPSGADLTPAQIAKWRIPGERENNECFQYAWCMRLVLAQKGVDARLVVYDWNRKTEVGHAVILFELDGKTYLVENEKDKPVQVTGATDLERVQCFDSKAYAVQANPWNAWDETAASGYLSRLTAARAKHKF